jgi:hypothetical protein
MSIIHFIDEKTAFTDEGGLAIKLLNKTGHTSILGEIVAVSSTTNEAVQLSAVDDVKSIGVVYSHAFANNLPIWVVICGICQVLIKDGTASTRGNWVECSDTAGRADATNADPPGGSIPALEEHNEEIGHCLESVSSGVSKKCFIMMHHN